MKKILFIICIIFSINSIGQNLDTIQVRNLSLRAEEWYWLKAQWYPTGQEEKTAWKKMRTKLTSDNPQTNATMVTIDSIPGKIALSFYNIFIRGSKGETTGLTNNISNNIKAYLPMLPFTNQADLEYQNRFQTNRQNGKDDFNN